MLEHLRASWTCSDVVFVGHSVSAMIGVLAAASEPERFARLVLVGPSPRYIDDDGYVGGFTREDIDGLLESMDSNYLGWSSAMAPVIMGNADRPELGEELDQQLLPRPIPRSPRHFARVTFLSDNRADLARVRDARRSCCSARDDVIAPDGGRRVRRTSTSPTAGSCSSRRPATARTSARPQETIAAIQAFLASRERADGGLLGDTAEDLFENAPCGYLSTRRTARSCGSTGRFEQLDGLRARAAGRPAALPGPADRRAAGSTTRRTTRRCCRCRAGCARSPSRSSRADGVAAARARQLDRADATSAGQPLVVRTIGLRRHRPPPLRAGAAARTPAASTRSPQQLQRSLLSGTLPAAPALDDRRRLRAGRRGPRGRRRLVRRVLARRAAAIALVVGDVVGRGIDAAATMGQLRSAVRALASTGVRPGALLDALDTYVAPPRGRAQRRRWSTPSSTSRPAQLRFACAGHPPPVLVQTGEEPCMVWDGRSAPLDVRIPPGGPRPEASRSLTPGSSVLFYTDGLVERRSQPMMDTLDELVEQAGRHRDSSAATLVGAVVAALDQATHADDVCLLVARLGALAQPS